jgi:hypothetical protein
MEHQPIPPQVQHAIVGILAVIGGACILAGAAIALYAAWIVYLVIDEPQRVPLAVQLVAMAARELQAVRGSMDGHAFELQLGAPVYWLLIALAGVLLLAVVVGVAKALITSGLQLLGPILRSRQASHPSSHPER